MHLYRIMPSLLDLPPEIISKIFQEVPEELSGTCTYFYAMYNDYYGDQLRREFGSFIESAMLKDRLRLVQYIRAFDYWRRPQRMIIARRYDLPETSEDCNCQWIRDSMKLIYGLYKNRRLFIEEGDYQVDEPGALNQGLLEINKTYMVKYNKSVRLAPGSYRFNCALLLQNSHGLSSTNFRVFDSRTGEVLSNYFPPSNVNDLLPRDKLVMLNVGGFKVEDAHSSEYRDKLINIDVQVEETGLYLKSGFVLCYMDIVSIGRHGSPDEQIAPRWISWSVDNLVPKPENTINLLLKSLYRSISQSLSLERQATDQSVDKQTEAAMADLDYNKSFYYKLAPDGTPFERTFRYYTIVDRRLEESRRSATVPDIDPQTEPLRWMIMHYTNC